MPVPRSQTLRVALIVMLALVVCSGIVVGFNHLRRIPETRAQVEDHLEREILAYAVIDGKPLIVSEWGGNIIHDTLKLDLISIEWPPTPRWQWTGNWDIEDPSREPATAHMSTVAPVRTVWGQLNDDRIVAIEFVVDDQVVGRADVSGGGFIVPLPDGVRRVDLVRFVDASGEVVHEAKP